jgi:hypothetical protein
MKTSLCTSFLLLLISCVIHAPDEKVYEARNDIRFGKRFFSILVRENGTAYVIKGIGSNYMDSLQIESADTSQIFKLDSSAVYFDRLKKLQSNPVFKSNLSGGARAEIYYHQQKICDSYHWGESFWDLFRPIMEQLPKGFSPFRVSEKPFG